MAGKRWLNIVVDGNIALQPYWHDIVSNYLENIIRSFRGNLLEEAYLGLVLYNANTELVETGFDVQFINWTKDANKFLENLSSLTFNGNDVNQCTMAEGLAEALVMYPKPSDIMPTIDYYNAERHCILVAPGDPTPKRMMLCLPMIQQGNLVGQRLKAREADFLDVSQMFPSLKISLSVITPNSLPIFGAIFNLGNDALLSNVPMSSYSNGQLTIMMSKNFQYAPNALIQENRPSTTSVESMNTTLTIPRVLASNFQASNTSSSAACEASIGERIDQASRTESASSQPLNFPELIFPNEVSPTDIALASFGHSQINLYDEIMAELSAETDILTPSKRFKTVVTLEEDNLHGLFETDHQLSFDGFNNSIGQEREKGESSTSKMISISEAFNVVDTELEQALKDGSNKTSNVELISSSSKGVYIPDPEVQADTSRTIQGITSNNSILNPNLSLEKPSSSVGLVPQQHCPRVGEEYSTRLFQDITSDNTVLCPTLRTKNPSNSNASAPQQQPLSLGEQYSTRIFQDNTSSSSSLVPQQHLQSVGEEYSTRLLEGITTNKSSMNLLLSSENPSSSSSVALVTQQHRPSVEEEYSTRLLQSITCHKSKLNPVLSLENSSNSNFPGLLNQQTSSSLWPTEPAQALYHQHGLMNNATQISKGASYSDDIFSNTMANSLLQFQPHSSQNQFPMPQDGSSLNATGSRGKFSGNQYQSNKMASFGANTLTFGTFNHQRNVLPVPTIDNFRHYVQTWKGSLNGRIHPNRVFMIRAKAFRSPTTPHTLTVEWANMLRISNFIPEKAVSDTKSIYDPIDYLFFHVVQYNNVDLYKYLKNSNLCGKVDLSSQYIIISPTQKEDYFLGTVFDRTAVFVEQH